MVKKVLLVLSSHEDLGNTGKKTGWWLGEAAHPYHVLTSKGFQVDFASPKGGTAPLDAGSTAEMFMDAVSSHFLNDPTTKKAVENTIKASDVDIKSYSAILYVGGHGTSWDFADNADLIKLVWAQGGYVTAVCHGPGGLLNLKDEKGELIIKGKNVTGFSNEEEEGVGLSKVVPHLLEDSLKAQGGNYSKAAGLWQPHVVVDGRLVTGQNPGSAAGVGEALAKLLA